MKDPADAIQLAVHSRLVNTSAVTTALGASGRILDQVVAGQAYPYVRIGDDQVVGDATACADGWEVYVNLHIFSRKAIGPRAEVKQISNAICQALGDNTNLIAPSDLNVIDVELEQSRTFIEADGVTAHGVLTFRFVVDDGA